MPAVDLFALFNQKYPCAANLMWVDASQGNDANPGSQAAPKQTLQGAMNAAGAGTRIMLRPGTYGRADCSNKHGASNNWIQVVGEPGARVQGDGNGRGVFQCDAASFIAIYGLEIVGIDAGGGDRYELAVFVATGGHSIAVWKCEIHNMSGHAVAAVGGARIDVCYNRMYDLAKWNEFAVSAISTIQMPNAGDAWPDGYHNRFIGNVIDATWSEESAIAGGPFAQWGITDGNGIIYDHSSGYTGRSLSARNLIVGCGGRGIHTYGTNQVDAFCNTSLDNTQNLDGTWIAEYSITDASDCKFQWNIGAARVGSNRVLLFQNAGNSTMGNTVFLRGTGGDEGNDLSVNVNGNINKTAVGPAGYFQQYQQGQFKAPSITNIAGYRPNVSQVNTFNPDTVTSGPGSTVRALLAGWPDPLGFLPPTTGNWAYGAFEATTDTAGPPPRPRS